MYAFRILPAYNTPNVYKHFETFKQFETNIWMMYNA